jgi:mycofactocin precursor
MSQSSQNTAPPVEAVLEADTLVEEVSIDGMCGVY